MVEAYCAEMGPRAELTPEELLASVNFWPIKEAGKLAGFFGYYETEWERTGPVAAIHFTYIKPEFRKGGARLKMIRKHAALFCEDMQKKGVKHIRMNVVKPIATALQWLGIKPVAHDFSGPIDRWIELLKKEKV